MYVIISGFISFESWVDTSLRMKKRIGWLVNGIFLMISLYFLSSRSGLLAVVVLIPVYLFLKVYKRKKLIAGFAILILLSILFLVVRTNERVSIGMDEISKESFFQRDGRIYIWESAIHSVRHNLILGVGIGDVKAELMKEYQLLGDQNLIQNRYNVHNQYLEILLENGIIGLTLFISIMIFMFYIAFTERNVLYGLFIIMMVIFFLFETVLNRLQGVTFFSLFSFLLIHINYDNQKIPVDIQKR
jgi:O-antigen ligase